MNRTLFLALALSTAALAQDGGTPSRLRLGSRDEKPSTLLTSRGPEARLWQLVKGESASLGLLQLQPKAHASPSWSPSFVFAVVLKGSASFAGVSNAVGSSPRGPGTGWAGLAGITASEAATEVLLVHPPAGMFVVGSSGPLTARAPQAIAQGHGKVRALYRSKPLYVGLLEGDASFRVPEHAHADEEELLYIIEGGGTLNSGGRRVVLTAGTALAIPRGEPHSFEPGAEGVKAVQVYSPAGPEQRFKKK